MAVLAFWSAIEETTTTTGTGTYTLAGAVAGRLAFGARYADAAEVYYTVEGLAGGVKATEVCRGVLGGSGTTLTRAAVLESTNGDAAVSWDAGTKRIYAGLPGPVLLVPDTDTALAANSDARVATQKAVKAYIDGLALNMGKRARVRAATTANVTISTALNNGDSLDGVTLATGDLVLVKNQSSAAENGVYVVGASPARSGEFDAWDEHPGSLIAVAEGSTNADTLWLCTSNAGGTLGTTAIAWTRMVTAGELLAVNNLSDLASAPTARTNLGLGTAAVANTGTTDGNVPVYASGAINMEDKTLQRPVLLDTAEKQQAISHTGSGGLTIDVTAGNVVALAQSANITSMTISNPSPTGNLCAVLIVRTKDNNGTARTIVWPSGTKHPGGTAPTLTQTANAVDRFLLSTTDAGTTWYCDALGAGYA